MRRTDESMDAAHLHGVIHFYLVPCLTQGNILPSVSTVDDNVKSLLTPRATNESDPLEVVSFLIDQLEERRWLHGSN